MKKLLTLFVIFCTSILYAQDIIVQVDSTRIDAKVVTVGDKTITYKRHNSPDGPTYEISRRYVARIQYADGTVEVYGKTANEMFSSKEKNVISITTTDIIAGVATLNYERTFFGKVGVKATGSIGMLGLSGKRPDYYTSSYYYNRFKIFSVGIDVHYTYYHGKNISLYTGVMTEYGQVRNGNYFWDFPPYGPIGPQKYLFGGLTNGIKIHTGTPLELDMFCTLGWRNTSSPYAYSDYSARVGLSLGYKF
jgi:hypothetical protein